MQYTRATTGAWRQVKPVRVLVATVLPYIYMIILDYELSDVSDKMLLSLIDLQDFTL